jgi:hypothetical protein
MNASFRLGSTDLVHLHINTGAMLVASSGDTNMFAKASKLSAPLAGAIFLASVGFASFASAAPMAAERNYQSSHAAPVIQIDNRRGNMRRGHGQWQRDQGWGYYELRPRQIRRSLRHRGFHKVRILDRRGPVYIVKARGWQGKRLRLVVDARTAQIVRIRPMHRRNRWQSRW